jgi:hypothetical protein
LYNLSTAAAATGASKSTIFRSIKAGRLSAQRNETGGWEIDPAELHRVFPPLPAAAGTGEQARAERDAIADQLVAELRGVIADLRQDRDQWRDLSQSQQKLLASPAEHGGTNPAPAAERGHLAEIEAATVPALRDTVAALKAALDAEQARNRELRRQRDAGGLFERAWRWARARG